MLHTYLVDCITEHINQQWQCSPFLNLWTRACRISDLQSWTVKAPCGGTQMKICTSFIALLPLPIQRQYEALCHMNLWGPQLGSNMGDGRPRWCGSSTRQMRVLIHWPDCPVICRNQEWTSFIDQWQSHWPWEERFCKWCVGAAEYQQCLQLPSPFLNL